MANGFDSSYMQQALDMARQPVSAPHPNPRVGCVIVNNDKIVAKGCHETPGFAHAEVAALETASDSLEGGTMYVTLEPCSSYGRTPPCAKRILSTGIHRVVIADVDPNPVNQRHGIAMLREAGITTEVGVLAEQAREMNRGFYSRHQRGRPFVVVKIAATMDGQIATASGASQWITGEAARQDVQLARAQADAVLTGVGTVLADNPRLTCRAAGATRQPLRIVMDSELRTPPDARLFDEPGDIVIATCQDCASSKRKLLEKNSQIIGFDSVNDRVDSQQLIAYLAGQQINEVLIEAGPTLIGALIEADVVDELVVYLAPALLGDAAMGMAHMPNIQSLADRICGQFSAVHRIGDDLRIHFKPTGRASE